MQRYNGIEPDDEDDSDDYHYIPNPCDMCRAYYDETNETTPCGECGLCLGDPEPGDYESPMDDDEVPF